MSVRSFMHSDNIPRTPFPGWNPLMAKGSIKIPREHRTFGQLPTSYQSDPESVGRDDEPVVDASEFDGYPVSGDEE